MHSSSKETNFTHKTPFLNKEKTRFCYWQLVCETEPFYVQEHKANDKNSNMKTSNSTDKMR